MTWKGSVTLIFFLTVWSQRPLGESGRRGEVPRRSQKPPAAAQERARCAQGAFDQPAGASSSLIWPSPLLQLPWHPGSTPSLLLDDKTVIILIFWNGDVELTLFHSFFEASFGLNCVESCAQAVKEERNDAIAEAARLVELLQQSRSTTNSLETELVRVTVELANAKSTEMHAHGVIAGMKNELNNFKKANSALSGQLEQLESDHDGLESRHRYGVV